MHRERQNICILKDVILEIIGNEVIYKSLNNAFPYLLERIPSLEIKRADSSNLELPTLIFKDSLKKTHIKQEKHIFYFTGDLSVFTAQVWYSLLLPLIAHSLEKRNIFLIESSIVEKNNHALMLTGKQGSGKGALAWYLGKNKFTVLSTGISVINHKLEIMSGTQVFLSQQLFIDKLRVTKNKEISSENCFQYKKLSSKGIVQMQDYPKSRKVNSVFHIHLQDVSFPVKNVEPGHKTMVLSSNMISRIHNAPILLSPWKKLIFPDYSGIDWKLRENFLKKLSELPHKQVYMSPDDFFIYCKKLLY